MIVAFDLDGTLCNIEHRLHFIQGEKKDWPAFFRACVDDKPVKAILLLVDALYFAGHNIEIWSGRNAMVLAQTQEWLSQHRVSYERLRMRKDGDYRADHIVKAEWLDALPEDQRPVIVFDDRQRVVDMWRSRGIKCCQVEPGDF